MMIGGIEAKAEIVGHMVKKIEEKEGNNREEFDESQIVN